MLQHTWQPMRNARSEFLADVSVIFMYSQLNLKGADEALLTGIRTRPAVNPVTN